MGLNLQNQNIIDRFMSYLWKHPDKWKSWCDKENCPVCLNAPMPPEYVTIRETDVTWLEATPNVPLLGTCYVMSKKHVVEIFELSDAEAFAFLKDVMSAAKALKEVTGAAKINYEIHGNTVPHLHIHLFPRYLEGDRFGDGIINPRDIEPSVYKEDKFELFVKKMRDALR